MKDWYVDADKNGDVVIVAPEAECWELINPIKSHWDPITEKAAGQAVGHARFQTRTFDSE